MEPNEPPGLSDLSTFSLLEALAGRRARRFSLGASIPSGELSYTSRSGPMPLSTLERGVVLTAVSGTTGWHYAIPFNARYAPDLPNYAGSAWGRTFPSAAGFHTSEVFFTDDSGTYLLPGRDGPEEAVLDQGPSRYLKEQDERMVRLSDRRMHLPPRDEHVEPHNHWCVNRPGSLLIIPVADAAQHMLLALCYLVQNGFGIEDDINGQAVPGLERFDDLVAPGRVYPLSVLEQQVVGECAAEVSTACFAGMLMLQAMGLGGWMFDGLNPLSVLGARGDPEVPGLRFRYDTDERWPVPNPTGLPGVFEGHAPPHFPDMRAAVEHVVERKFGPGGPFNASTPGAWKDSARVRGSARRHDERFIDCVSTMAQYVLDRFGRFPATVPTMWTQVYLQAHHLDLEFYDAHFRPGAYLATHARHMERWHGPE